MAITKERKEELVGQYVAWSKRSRALILTQYVGLSMKDIDALRSKVREVGGEFHVVKNTLGELALKEAGMSVPEGYLVGSTAIAFAFQDAPAMAKVLVDFAKTTEALKFKGGFLGTNPINAAGVRMLADLPPLPVMRAQLLGMLVAPASKLMRTLAEPGRQVAAVIKAYAEPEAADAVA